MASELRPSQSHRQDKIFQGLCPCKQGRGQKQSLASPLYLQDFFLLSALHNFHKFGFFWCGFFFSGACCTVLVLINHCYIHKSAFLHLDGGKYWPLHFIAVAASLSVPVCFKMATEPKVCLKCVRPTLKWMTPHLIALNTGDTHLTSGLHCSLTEYCSTYSNEFYERCQNGEFYTKLVYLPA